MKFRSFGARDFLASQPVDDTDMLVAVEPIPIQHGRIDSWFATSLRVRKFDVRTGWSFRSDTLLVRQPFRYFILMCWRVRIEFVQEEVGKFVDRRRFLVRVVSQRFDRDARGFSGIGSGARHAGQTAQEKSLSFGSLNVCGQFGNRVFAILIIFIFTARHDGNSR